MALFSVFFNCFVFLSQLRTLVSATEEWNYDYDDEDRGPFAWHKLSGYETCGGDTQSPINIPTHSEDGFEQFNNIYTFGSTIYDDTFLDTWDWNDKYIHNFKIINNGKFINFTPINAKAESLNLASNAIARFVDNIESNSSYCLDSFHLHWGSMDIIGSEHTQFGVHYPSEIHFVHYDCTHYQSLSDALNGNETENENEYPLAVIGFLFELDDNATIEETSTLTKVTQRLGGSKCNDLGINVANLNLLGSFFPFSIEKTFTNREQYRSDSNFWYYKGSLTTPGCNAVVRWHVFDYKLKITTDQLNVLRNLQDKKGGLIHNNWRPIQENVNDVFIFEFENDESEGEESDNDSDDR